MSTSLSPRTEKVAVLPSLPPSPSFLDEVLSYPHLWSVHLDDFDSQHSRRSSSRSARSHAKGKGTQTVEDEDENVEGTEQRASLHEAYPPTTDGATETRRVEETLKRWELAERRRRKSARESAQYTARPSLFSSVTRTAGLVLSGRTSIGTAVAPGSFRALKSHDTVDVAREGYAVPLDDIDHPRDVTVHSPSPSHSERNTSLDAGAASCMGSGTSENPFDHPLEHTRTPTRSLTPVTPTSMLPSSEPPSPSPFSDRHAQQAVQGDLAARLSASSRTKQSLAIGSRTSLTPPSRPLGLPPAEDTPRATQFQPTSKPVLRPRRTRDDPEERQEVRWWHDWLCGCSEGPDRGGDNQAGRTNPFE